MIEFIGPSKVRLTELISPQDADHPVDVWTSKKITKTDGTYTIDDTAQTIIVVVGGVRTTYLAYTPPGIDGCMLISGSPSAADLVNSWFGTLDPPETDPPNDQP